MTPPFISYYRRGPTKKVSNGGTRPQNTQPDPPIPLRGGFPSPRIPPYIVFVDKKRGDNTLKEILGKFFGKVGCPLYLSYMNLCEQVLRIKQVMNLNESEDSDFIFSLLNDFTKDAKLYLNPDRNSIWMIFPKEKKWVFEFDATLKSGGVRETILYYNLDFFKIIFKYLSMNVINHEKYIKEWVENIINKKIDDIRPLSHYKQKIVNDTLKKRNEI